MPVGCSNDRWVFGLCGCSRPAPLVVAGAWWLHQQVGKGCLGPAPFVVAGAWSLIRFGLGRLLRAPAVCGGWGLAARLL